MIDAGNTIQMYQERIERLERALDKCKEQRDEYAGLRDISDEEYILMKDMDEALINKILFGE